MGERGALDELAPEARILVDAFVAAPAPEIVGAEVKDLADAVLLRGEDGHVAKWRCVGGVAIIDQYLRGGFWAGDFEIPIDWGEIRPEGGVRFVIGREAEHLAGATEGGQF